MSAVPSKAPLPIMSQIELTHDSLCNRYLVHGEPLSAGSQSPICKRSSLADLVTGAETSLAGRIEGHDDSAAPLTRRYCSGNTPHLQSSPIVVTTSSAVDRFIRVVLSYPNDSSNSQDHGHNFKRPNPNHPLPRHLPRPPRPLQCPQRPHRNSHRRQRDLRRAHGNNPPHQLMPPTNSRLPSARSPQTQSKHINYTHALT